jgi:hypothetical protein
MIYYVDFTEEGKKCELNIKSQDISCQVICSFVRITNKGVENITYSLLSKDKLIYEYVPKDRIKFKK